MRIERPDPCGTPEVDRAMADFADRLEAIAPATANLTLLETAVALHQLAELHRIDFPEFAQASRLRANRDELLRRAGVDPATLRPVVVHVCGVRVEITPRGAGAVSVIATSADGRSVAGEICADAMQAAIVGPGQCLVVRAAGDAEPTVRIERGGDSATYSIGCEVAQ